MLAICWHFGEKKSHCKVLLQIENDVLKNLNLNWYETKRCIYKTGFKKQTTTTTTKNLSAIIEESLGKDNKNSSLLRECSASNSFTIWLRGKRWQPTPVFLPGHPTDRGDWWATVHGVIRELYTT